MSPSNINTWRYLEDRISGLEVSRSGRTFIIKIHDEEIRLVPYPEVCSVRLIRNGGVRPDVPSGWIAQWKANGSNIRIYSLGEEIIAVSRGGFLLDWKPYSYLLKSAIKDKLVEATEGGRYLLFGELVGPQSLVRLCIGYWRKYLGEDIGYLLFDVFDMDKQIFIDMKSVEALARRHGLMFSPTEWSLELGKLLERIEEFLGICGGEVWEGFVFKDPRRGTYRDIEEGTLKWRLDETREYAKKIYRRIVRDPLAWKIYEAFRKFVFEGYLDPPITLEQVGDDALEVRNRIQSIIEGMEKGDILKEKADKMVKKELYRLAEKILSQKVKSDRWYNKARGGAIKLFRRLHIYTY